MIKTTLLGDSAADQPATRAIIPTHWAPAAAGGIAEEVMVMVMEQAAEEEVRIVSPVRPRSQRQILETAM